MTERLNAFKSLCYRDGFGYRWRGVVVLIMMTAQLLLVFHRKGRKNEEKTK